MVKRLTADELIAARGESVYARDGERIGSVEEMFVDEDTGEPEWIGVGAGFPGTKRVVVPVTGAERAEGGLRVPYTTEHVRQTPDLDSDEISQETEIRLYAHYGLERRPIGSPATGPGAVGEGRVSLEEEVARETERVLDAVRRERVDPAGERGRY